MIEIIFDFIGWFFMWAVIFFGCAGIVIVLSSLFVMSADWLEKQVEKYRG